MRIRFFTPTSKVQKDRVIMRETDERMAKYSRRGLISNLLAFLVCLAVGSFYQHNRDLAMILLVGLLFFTSLRGFLLFRFNAVYPRAPARWRNLYFVATLLGAFWWGLIMSSITFELEMRDIAPLFWLYTCIFFSTTAHPFAPYNKFLSIYQFAGLIPGAVAAILLGDALAYFYGALLIMFYFMLRHQCTAMSQNYWDKLEAQYVLARKETSLQVAKRDVQATQELSRDFIAQLQKELRAQCPSEQKPEPDYRALSAMADRISEFSSVLNRSVTIKKSVFNIRHSLQHHGACSIEKAEKLGVELDVFLSPALPMRIKSDAKKVAQVLNALLDMALENVDSGVVVLEADFIRHSEVVGDLVLTVNGIFPPSRRVFFLDERNQLEQGLHYYVMKGLAETMNGAVELVKSSKAGFEYRFSLPVELAHLHGQLDFHRGSFGGRKMLLVHANPRIQEIKRRQLDDLGFKVVVVSSYKQALLALTESYREKEPIQNVFYFLNANDEEGMGFMQQIADDVNIKYVRQFICVFTTARRQVIKKLSDKEYKRIFLIDKPAGLFELELFFARTLLSSDEALPSALKEKKSRSEVVFYSRQDGFELALKEKLAEKKYVLKQVKKTSKLVNLCLETQALRVILIDADSGFDLGEIAQMIRNAEVEAGVEFHIPLLCVGSSKAGKVSVSACYQAGMDDFIDLEAEAVDFETMVKGWFVLAGSEVPEQI